MKNIEKFLTAFIILMTIGMVSKKLIELSDEFNLLKFTFIILFIPFYLIQIMICSEWIFEEALRPRKRTFWIIMSSFWIYFIITFLLYIQGKAMIQPNTTENYRKFVFQMFQNIIDSSYWIVFINAYFITLNYESSLKPTHQ